MGRSDRFEESSRIYTIVKGTLCHIAVWVVVGYIKEDTGQPAPFDIQNIVGFLELKLMLQ